MKSSTVLCDLFLFFFFRSPIYSYLAIKTTAKQIILLNIGVKFSKTYVVLPLN